MIHQAAESVRPERAIILGAGRCQEIPLSELVDRFASVTLNDHDPLMLEEALSTSGLSHAHSLKVETLVADLTGVTLGFLKIEPSQQTGTTGRIFNTQGLVFSLKSPPQ